MFCEVGGRIGDIFETSDWYVEISQFSNRKISLHLIVLRPAAEHKLISMLSILVCRCKIAKASGFPNLSVGEQSTKQIDL